MHRDVHARATCGPVGRGRGPASRATARRRGSTGARMAPTWGRHHLRGTRSRSPRRREAGRRLGGGGRPPTATTATTQARWHAVAGGSLGLGRHGPDERLPARRHTRRPFTGGVQGAPVTTLGEAPHGPRTARSRDRRGGAGRRESPGPPGAQRSRCSRGNSSRGSSTKRQGQGAARTQRGQGAEWVDPPKGRHRNGPYAKFTGQWARLPCWPARA